MYCHKCPYNGKQSTVCLSCDGTETYSYRYQHYLLDGYDPPQPDTSTSEQATSLDDELEDVFRKAICDIFSLRPIELLFVQAVMNGKTLTEFATDMNRFAHEICKRKDGITRFSAFQLKKLIIKKLPFMMNALITQGQRKELKQHREQRLSGKADFNPPTVRNGR